MIRSLSVMMDIIENFRGHKICRPFDLHRDRSFFYLNERRQKKTFFGTKKVEKVVDEDFQRGLAMGTKNEILKVVYHGKWSKDLIKREPLFSVIVLDKKPRKDVSSDEYEFFCLDELVINIHKHVYVPRHFVLGEEETEVVCKKYGKESLPLIKWCDPPVKTLGGKPGQVVMIVRKSPFMDNNMDHMYYRRIV